MLRAVRQLWAEAAAYLDMFAKELGVSCAAHFVGVAKGKQTS